MFHRARTVRYAWWVTGCALLGASPPPSPAGEGKPRPEITVVGTVHSPTAAFTQESLTAILRKIQPDLVLLELDPSFFDDAYVLQEKYRSVSMENEAALAYAKTAAVPVKMRPFDIEGRNRFYQEQDYFRRESRMNQEIARLHRAGELPLEARLLFEALTALAAVRDACGVSPPEVMNAAPCDAAIERKQDYAFKGMGRIVEVTPALQEFKSFAALADSFWARRNEAMVASILRRARETQAKRIVVLCGFEHRYYLRRRLAENPPGDGFLLKDP